MADAYKPTKVCEKAAALLAEHLPAIGNRLSFFASGETDDKLFDRIAQAMAGEVDDPKGLAFHITDWRAEAAFLVALVALPEHFTDEEIIQGVYAVIFHGWYHINEASKVVEES